MLIGLGFALAREHAPDKQTKDKATVVYAVQMTFFFCWMIWFFNLGWRGFAAIWLLGMILSILAMIAVYRGISRLAAWLQVPYLLWSIFALYLNIGFFILNR